MISLRQGVLYTNYRPSAFWYEFVVLLRRGLMVALDVGFVLQPDSKCGALLCSACFKRLICTLTHRHVAMAIVLLTMLAVQIRIKPFVRDVDNVLEEISLLCLIAIASVLVLAPPFADSIQALLSVLVVRRCFLLATDSSRRSWCRLPDLCCSWRLSGCKHSARTLARPSARAPRSPCTDELRVGSLRRSNSTRSLHARRSTTARSLATSSCCTVCLRVAWCRGLRKKSFFSFAFLWVPVLLSSFSSFFSEN